MPEFNHNGKSYNNPVEFALDRIGGKWKMPILWRLNERMWRYGELRRDLKKITAKMLTQQLRELEEDGLIHRKVYAEVPPRVEYTITRSGKSAIPVIRAIRKWGQTRMRAAGITVEPGASAKRGPG